MTVWLIRAGANGEYEQKFIQEDRVYITWDSLDVDLSKLSSRQALFTAMAKRYPDVKEKAIHNWVSQVWPFAHDIKESDLVVLPLKTQRAIQIGEVVGDYHFEPEGPNPFFHWRNVKWIGEAIPRENFGQDLLYSFGAFMTVCRIQRNNAENRITAMRENGWKPESIKAATKGTPVTKDGETDLVEEIDLEEAAGDKIVKLINARFKGHELTKLVDGILRAQGYITYQSPEGADGGVDILAGAGPLGFSAPRLCVEVKSGDGPVDRPTVDKLLGAITKFKADEGLFVSWGGFKSNVQRELAAQFFQVRLWGKPELLGALFANYDRLDEEIKAELPLKRIWIVTSPEDE